MNSEKKASSDHDDASRRRPGATRKREENGLGELARRVEKTYRARLMMAKRLQLRAAHWNTALVALTLSATVASTALLFQTRAYGAHGDVLLVIVAIFTLVASLTVASTNYPEKARRAFEVYRQLQRLAVQIASAAADPPRTARKRKMVYSAFDRSYQTVLDESENHSAADYARAVQFGVRMVPNDVPIRSRFDLVSGREYVGRSLQIVGSQAVTLAPVALTFGSAVFAIPALVWTVSGFPN